MRFWKHTRIITETDLAERQREADNAVIIANLGLQAANELHSLALKVHEGHVRLQTENHLGEKMFGVTNE